MLDFLFSYLFPFVAIYVYGVITVAKYDHFTRKLNLDDEDAAKSGKLGFTWPIALCIDPREVKGLLYPTLWLWSRFREEYPAIKAKEKIQHNYYLDLKRKENDRERQELRGQALLHDSKREFTHHRKLAAIDKETEEWREKLIKDIPPQLESGETYAQMKREEEIEIEAAAPAIDADWRCKTPGHMGHWINMETKRSDCT